MTLAPDLDGAERPEADWMPLIVFIQSKGNMRWEEILSSPLIRLNSIHKQLAEIWQHELMGSLGLGSMLTPTPAQPKEPLMGKMPEFDNDRDAYFAFVNKHCGG